MQSILQKNRKNIPPETNPNSHYSRAGRGGEGEWGDGGRGGEGERIEAGRGGEGEWREGIIHVLTLYHREANSMLTFLEWDI